MYILYVYIYINCSRLYGPLYGHPGLIHEHLYEHLREHLVERAPVAVPRLMSARRACRHLRNKGVSKDVR